MDRREFVEPAKGYTWCYRPSKATVVNRLSNHKDDQATR